MKAIVTKYLGPTNHKGARITATEPDGKRATVSYDHALSGADVHFEAVKALCRKLGWDGTLAAGATKDGYVFVFVPSGMADAFPHWESFQVGEVPVRK